MKRGTFEAALPEGFIPADAYLSGPFAVHRPIGVWPLRRGRGWRISHVVTGFVLPDLNVRTLADAEKICRRLAKLPIWQSIVRGKRHDTPIIPGRDEIAKIYRAELIALKKRKLAA